MQSQKSKETKPVFVFCVEFTWVEKPTPPEIGDVRKAVLQRQTNYVSSIEDALHLIRDWMDPLDDEVAGLSYEEYRNKVSYCPWDSKESFDQWMKRELKRTKVFKKIEKDLKKTGFDSLAQIVGSFVEYDVKGLYEWNTSEILHSIRVEHTAFDVQKGHSPLFEIARQLADAEKN